MNFYIPRKVHYFCISDWLQQCVCTLVNCLRISRCRISDKAKYHMYIASSAEKITIPLAIYMICGLSSLPGK